MTTTNISLDTDISILVKKLEREMEDLEPLREASSGEWRTKCSFVLSDGQIVNLKKATKEQVFQVTSEIFKENQAKKETIIFLSLTASEIKERALLQGFEADEWLEDLKKRWDFVTLREKEKTIRTKIEKTKALMSEDAKKRLELANIMND